MQQLMCNKKTSELKNRNVHFNLSDASFFAGKLLDRLD